MAIKKTEAGWQVDIQPGGRGGKCFRKTFPTKLEAKQWENWVKSKTLKNPDWQPESKDKRKLSDLVDLWYKHHGISLKAAKDTSKRLYRLCEVLGNPSAEAFNAQIFADYRVRRLKEGVSPNTLNREFSYLRGVFGELKRLGYWTKPNPLSSVRQFKIPERELSFLTARQIERLLKAFNTARNKDVLLLTKLCLATGARWSEALKLTAENVRLSPASVTFVGTKNGKNRTVPISEELAKELSDKKTTGRLFQSCYGAFREGVERAGIELPKGQLAHVLRHTFASHFIMNGGNILVLQKILGHHSITVTMKYAHLAPDHLNETVALNPLSKLG